MRILNMVSGSNISEAKNSNSNSTFSLSELLKQLPSNWIWGQSYPQRLTSSPTITISDIHNQEEWVEVTNQQVNEIQQEYKIIEEVLAKEKQQREEAKQQLKQLKSLSTDAQTEKMAQLLKLEKDLAQSKLDIKKHKSESQRYLNEKIAQCEKLIAAHEENAQLKQEQIRIAHENKFQQETLVQALLEKDQLIQKSEQEKITLKQTTQEQLLAIQQLQEKLIALNLALQQEKESNKIALSQQQQELDHIKEKARLNALVVIEERKKNDAMSHIIEIEQEAKHQLPIKPKKTRKWPWYGTATLSLGGGGFGTAAITGYGVAATVSGPIGWLILTISLFTLLLSAHQIRKAHSQDKLATAKYNQAILLSARRPQPAQISDTTFINHQTRTADTTNKKRLLSPTEMKSDETDEEEKSLLIELPQTTSQALGAENESPNSFEKDLHKLQQVTKQQQATALSLEKKSAEIAQEKATLEKQKIDLEKRELALTQQQLKLEVAQKQWEADLQPANSELASSDDNVNNAPPVVPVAPPITLFIAPSALSSTTAIATTTKRNFTINNSEVAANTLLSGIITTKLKPVVRQAEKEAPQPTDMSLMDAMKNTLAKLREKIADDSESDEEDWDSEQSAKPQNN